MHFHSDHVNNSVDKFSIRITKPPPRNASLTLCIAPLTQCHRSSIICVRALSSFKAPYLSASGAHFLFVRTCAPLSASLGRALTIVSQLCAPSLARSRFARLAVRAGLRPAVPHASFGMHFVCARASAQLTLRSCACNALFKGGFAPPFNPLHAFL